MSYNNVITAAMLPSNDILEMHQAATESVDKINRDLALDTILRDALKEMKRQVDKWGVQRHADGVGSFHFSLKAETLKRENDVRAVSGTPYWSAILEEEIWEAFAEKTGTEELRTELIQSVAVLLSWLQDIDTRGGTTSR